MLPAGTSWFQIGLAEVFSGGLEKLQMVQSGSRRTHVVPGGPSLVQLRLAQGGENCPRCSQMVPDGPQNGAAEVIPNDPEQFQVVCPRWFQGSTG